jgi:hypothetical protein
MKQTKKANQLRLVRNVVRELSSSDLGAVNGGACGGSQVNRGGGCIAPSCYLDTGVPPVACGSASG